MGAGSRDEGHDDSCEATTENEWKGTRRKSNGPMRYREG